MVEVDYHYDIMGIKCGEKLATQNECNLCNLYYNNSSVYSVNLLDYGASEQTILGYCFGVSRS